MNSSIYAIKGDPDKGLEFFLTSLRQGEGRFGWSYIETADLNYLKGKIEKEGWNSLSEKEKDCYQGFLLDIKDGDYVIYINVPSWSKCSVARITGPYFWRYDGSDFNHRFPVDPSSVFIFDRNDAIVHPALKTRLRLQGRYWHIYAKDEFELLLESQKAGKAGKPTNAKVRLAFLAKEIQPHLLTITEKIHHTHPNNDLEALMVETLKNIPNIKEVKWQGGSGDNGADILIVFEAGLPILGLQQQRTCVIQIKSFEGEHWNTRAVDDIRRAFEKYPEANMGLIVSTATRGTVILEESLEKLRVDTGKPVSLLIGADVAAFFLRFGLQLLT